VGAAKVARMVKHLTLTANDGPVGDARESGGPRVRSVMATTPERVVVA
jgi:hypothetical protein